MNLPPQSDLTDVPMDPAYARGWDDALAYTIGHRSTQFRFESREMAGRYLNGWNAFHAEYARLNPSGSQPSAPTTMNLPPCAHRSGLNMQQHHARGWDAALKHYEMYPETASAMCRMGPSNASRQALSDKQFGEGWDAFIDAVAGLNPATPATSAWVSKPVPQAITFDPTHVSELLVKLEALVKASSHLPSGECYVMDGRAAFNLLPEIITTLKRQRSELSKWEDPSLLANEGATQAQYEATPTSLAAAGIYIVALQHALGHARKELEQRCEDRAQTYELRAALIRRGYNADCNLVDAVIGVPPAPADPTPTHRHPRD